MTKITRDDVRALAQLGNVRIEDDEIDALAHDIERTLGYVELLDELNTDNVDPTYQVTDRSNVWREDEPVQDLDPTALVQLNQPNEHNQIKVPKVL